MGSFSQTANYFHIPFTKYIRITLLFFHSFIIRLPKFPGMKKQILLLSVTACICCNESTAQINQVAPNTSSYNAVKADVPAGSGYSNNSSSNYNNYQANTLQQQYVTNQ